MKEHLLSFPVVQANGTSVQVLNDGCPDGSKSYMWVHRSREFFRDKASILYEYQKTRHHKQSLEFYEGFNGVVMTDGFQQYHLVEQKLQGLTNANCWVHACRNLADACRAVD